MGTDSQRVGTDSHSAAVHDSHSTAVQTLKFAKDLGKYTDLRLCLLVGGDSMEEQVPKNSCVKFSRHSL